jgi:hypothetical protein
MGEPLPGAPPFVRPPEDRLDSWKEIAAYLNRDVTTVQRWEKREGMPVHRHLHDRMGSVYAFRADLDAWARSRSLRAAQEDENDAPSPARCTAAGSHRPIDPMEVVLPLAAESVWRWGKPLVQRTEYFWRTTVTRDFRRHGLRWSGGPPRVTRRPLRGVSVGRDGQDVRYAVGSGQFHNLTRGSAPELVPWSAPWGSRPMALS